MLRRIVSELINGRRVRANRQRSAQLDDGRAPGGLKPQALAEGVDPIEQRLRCRVGSEPDNAEAHRQLGAWLGANGRLDEACRELARALELEPDSATGLADMGNVLRMQGALADAEKCYRRALALDPELVLARLNVASLLEAQAPDEAAELYRELAVALGHPVAIRNAVTFLDGLGRSAEARNLCERVLERAPSDFEANRGLGFLLPKREFSAAAALVHLDRAVAIDPGDVESLANRGIALQDLGRIEEAIEAYDAVLALRPEHEVARFHRALALLLLGEFERGWDDYELRLATQDHPQRRFAAPRWQGEDLSGKMLLVHAEQGIGDEIMFASCIPDAAARCKSLVLECSPKLAPIFARSFPYVRVQAGSQLDPPQVLDALSPDRVIAAGSLPRHFRRSRASFPNHTGYLRADPGRTQYYRARLQDLGHGLKVGISWRGGTQRSRGPLRTLVPEQLASILTIQGVHFVDLQYDGTPDERERLQRQVAAVHTWAEALAVYDETAALVSALDLVISVCTAVVHLGGALGRAVWVLAPFSPEWRYGIAGERMPWYPSVRVFRQQSPGEWDELLGRVAQRLHHVALGTTEELQ